MNGPWTGEECTILNHQAKEERSAMNGLWTEEERFI